MLTSIKRKVKNLCYQAKQTTEQGEPSGDKGALCSEKESILQKDVTIINLHVPNNRPSVQQILTQLKGQLKYTHDHRKRHQYLRIQMGPWLRPAISAIPEVEEH